MNTTLCATAAAISAIVVQVAFQMSAAYAQTYYCDRPRKPSCIDAMAISRDEVTFQTCRDEVEHYQRRSVEYQDCLRMEFDDMASERKKQIDRFNSCAQNTYCY